MQMGWGGANSFQAEDGIRDLTVTGVQTCALPISQPTDDQWGDLLFAWRVASRGTTNAIVVAAGQAKIGRASCREREEISVGAVSLKKKNHGMARRERVRSIRSQHLDFARSRATGP